MGNMPNKWAGRGVALALAVISGIVGGFIGMWIGGKIAYGFTFDWYVHETHAAYPLEEVLPHVASGAAISGFLSILIGVFVTSASTRALMKKLRYTPPRLANPVSVDVHFGRLVLVALIGIPLLATLLAYVVLAWPYLWPAISDLLRVRAPTGSGAVIERVTPSGLQLLIGAANAFGAFVATLIAKLTTFSGLVSGRIVHEGRRNLIAHASLFGMRNARTTVAIVVGITLLAGISATTITTNVDVAEVLPRGDPNTLAAHNLTDKFKSSFTQQVTFQFRAVDPGNRTQMELFRDENAEKLPNRVSSGQADSSNLLSALPTSSGAVANPTNITDELYIRAMAEMIDWVVRQEPFSGSIGAPDFYKLINWTMQGGNNASDDAFGLPDTSREGSLAYATVEQGVINVEATFSALDAVTSPSWKQTAILVTVGPEYNGSTKYIGERALQIREEWIERVRNGETEYTIFGPDNPPIFSVDLPIANAHASELAAHDFKILLPIIAIFIAMTLFIAFRNAVSVIATFSMLAIATVWTFGVMGALKIPLNTLNLATVPLIMGIGIDYGIHMMNEYIELRSEGKSPEEAWSAAGSGSALALFVGLLTTVSGLMVMVVSPSLLVSQLGLLSAMALVSCYLLAIIFIPALVSLIGEGRGRSRQSTHYRPSRVMPALATGISRARWLVVIVLLLMAGAALASASDIRREAFGDPPRNWLEDDPLRQMHEEAILGFYDSVDAAEKANVIVIQGDLTDPAVHDYINNLTATLRLSNQTGWIDPQTGTREPSLVLADTLRDLPFLLNTYLTVRDGIPGAGQHLGASALRDLFEQNGVTDPSGRTQNYPDSREELLAIIDEVYDSPLYQLANLFLSAPEYDMTVIVFSVKASTYEDAEAVWWEVQAALAANEDARPEGVQATFFGNTAINYLFVAKQVPWLGYMSIATNIIVVFIVFAFTRSVRVTAAVGTLNFLTSTLWLGVLPAFGIGLAINLTLPLVFIFCMGSDYGLHLAMRCKRTGDTYAAMEGVGKGVLFSFLTTLGAFLVFTQISDLAGRRGMIATAVAITVVFISALLVIPVFYPVKKKDAEKHEGMRHVPVVETRDTPGAATRVVEVWQGDRKTIRPLDAE